MSNPSLGYALIPCSLAMLMLSASLGGQTLVTDLNQDLSSSNPDSDPNEFVRLDPETVLFAATDTLHGRELWGSDGSTAGTELLIDIEPGPVGSQPRDLVLFQGRLYFMAQTTGFGFELWSTDGTAAGTTLVRDAVPGPEGLDPGALGFQMVATPSKLFFYSLDDTVGGELWVSDGTEQGTHLLADIHPTTGSGPRELTAVGNLLFFTAIDGDEASPGGHGRELWVSDGTTAGTLRLTDLPGNINFPMDLGAFGNRVFFRARDVTGEEAWVSDGTPGGTHLFYEFVPGPGGGEPREFTAIGSQLYFSAIDPLAGREPWVSDGTALGTHLIGDLHDASFPLNSDFRDFVPLGGKVAFVSGSYGLATSRLFLTDGTLAGTTLLAELDNADFDHLVSLGSRAVLTFNDVFGGQSPQFALWGTDGTAAGTGQLVGPSVFGVVGGSIYADGGLAWLDMQDSVAGHELFTSDGTLGGTGLLADIHPPAGDSGVQGPFVSFEGRLFFAGDDGRFGASLGEEIYVTDGSERGTQLFADIHPGPGDSEPSRFTIWNDSLVFRANNGVHGYELHRTDGVSVEMIADATPGPFDGVASNMALVPFGDLLLFKNGFDLWVTDGTESGTQQLAEDIVGHEPVIFGNEAFFSSPVSPAVSANLELWRTDGTPEGTELVIDLNGSLSSSPHEFARVPGGFVFRADTTAEGVELWFSDGTPGGTELILDASVGSTDSWPETVEFGEMALVVTEGNSAPHRLWSTDGSAAGTQLLWEPSLGTGAVQRPVIAGTTGYFWASDDILGYQLWRTDGTRAGTEQVSDFDSASIAGSISTAMAAVGSGRELLFTVDLPATGEEAWLTDGTLAGTLPLTEIAPGPLEARPRDYARLLDQVLFSANDASIGTELYSISFASTEGYVAEPFGVSCPGTGGMDPLLTAAGAPRVGTSFDALLQGAPASALAALFFSLDASFLDVSPGCQLYLASPITLASGGATSTEGELTLTLPVPNQPGLVALPIFFQFLIDDPGQPFGGIGLSNGLEVLVGP